jgi:hypothetical protein
MIIKLVKASIVDQSSISLKLPFYLSFVFMTFLDPIVIFFYETPGTLTFFTENFSGYSAYFYSGGNLILFF